MFKHSNYNRKNNSYILSFFFFFLRLLIIFCFTLDITKYNRTKNTGGEIMLANQRKDKILELLKEDGSAKVVNLAKPFKVTEVTIRQDLEKLEKEGLVLRE